MEFFKERRRKLSLFFNINDVHFLLVLLSRSRRDDFVCLQEKLSEVPFIRKSSRARNAKLLKEKEDTTICNREFRLLTKLLLTLKRSK